MKSRRFIFEHPSENRGGALRVPLALLNSTDSTPLAARTLLGHSDHPDAVMRRPAAADRILLPGITIRRSLEPIENAIRKDFLPSEIDAIRRALLSPGEGGC
jgi:hypothetical protein